MLTKVRTLIHEEISLLSRRGIVLECTENDHFHGRNTHLKWLFAAPRASFSHALNVRNIPFLEVSRLYGNLDCFRKADHPPAMIKTVGLCFPGTTVPPK